MTRTMMLARAGLELRYPAEFLWLIGLAFFLPLFEAPKHVCLAAFVVTWLANRARARDWGGPWDRWDSLIALWIASAYLVAAFAGVHHDEWRGATDVLKYGSVMWLLKRSRYDERALLWILATVIAATLAALAWGYWRAYVTKANYYLELNSVGHVNHSAIYLGIAFGAALSVALAYWEKLGAGGKAALGIAVTSLLGSVFVTESRAAVGAVVLLVFVIVAAFGVRGRINVWKGLIVASLVVAITLAGLPGVLDKTVDKTVEGVPLSYRDNLWSNAMVEWRQYPLFGVGMGNFGRVSLDQLQEWNKSRDWKIRPTAQGGSSHAHSLYFTTLAERGLVGFAVLVAVLLAWGAALARGLPSARVPVDWALLGAAFAAWFVTIVVGIVNTTLHDEHGILSALLFGLWLGHRGTGGRSGPGQHQL